MEKRIIKLTESELKSLIVEKVIHGIKEGWGDTHQAPSLDVNPEGYSVGSRYFYTDKNKSQFEPEYKPIFVINDIENGKIRAVDSENNYQDNPSVSELNNLINSGNVIVKENRNNKSIVKLTESELKSLIIEKINKVLQEGVAKNNPKVEKLVNQLNELIASFIDSNGDPIGVIDTTSTWEEPYVYLPIEYKNGALRIRSYSEYDSRRINTEIIRSRDMEDDGIPTLKHIKHMYVVAAKRAKKNDEMI